MSWLLEWGDGAISGGRLQGLDLRTENLGFPVVVCPFISHVTTQPYCERLFPLPRKLKSLSSYPVSLDTFATKLSQLGLNSSRK